MRAVSVLYLAKDQWAPFGIDVGHSDVTFLRFQLLMRQEGHVCARAVGRGTFYPRIVKEQSLLWPSRCSFSAWVELYAIG